MRSHFEMAVTFMSIFGVSIFAHAAIDCSLYSRDGFVSVKEIANVLATHAASVSIKFLLKNGLWEGCSGAVVSDQGHIMTAGHCFENCSDSKSRQPSPYYSYSFFAGYDQKKERPSKCIAEIDGVETTVDIKLTSACSFEAHQMAAGVTPPQKCSDFNEIAIFLPQTKLPEKRCLPLARDYKIGELVYTIGYPSETERGEMDSDGQSQFASFGRIIPYSQKCTITKNSSEMDKIHRVNQPGDVVDFDPIFNPAMKLSAIQTTVDAVPGSSGGPLINQNGEIIAVGSFGDTQKNNRFKQCKGASFFSPVAGVNTNVSHFAADFKLSDLVCKEQKIKLTR